MSNERGEGELLFLGAISSQLQFEISHIIFQWKI